MLNAQRNPSFTSPFVSLSSFQDLPGLLRSPQLITTQFLQIKPTPFDLRTCTVDYISKHPERRARDEIGAGVSHVVVLYHALLVPEQSSTKSPEICKNTSPSICASADKRLWSRSDGYDNDQTVAGFITAHTCSPLPPVTVPAKFLKEAHRHPDGWEQRYHYSNRAMLNSRRN